MKVSSAAQRVRRGLDRSFSRHVIKILLAVIVAAFPPQYAASEEAPSSEYYLGPQDRLEVKVFDLRPGSVDIHQWAPFSGDVVVDASGRIALPLIGTIDAQGKTVGQIAEKIAASIQQRAGLLQMPNATVQITKYRPIYIGGDVDKPGEYDFRPGLSVLQAINIAGGMRRLKDQDLVATKRDFLTLEGEMRSLKNGQKHFLIKMARLTAEIDGAPSISFPDIIKSSADDKDLQRAIKDEKDLFDLRRSIESEQISTLENARKSISEQLSVLKLKDISLGKQIDLVKRDLEQVRQLASRGLTNSSREISAEQSVAAFESSKLDGQVGIIRAQQEISKAEIDLTDVKSKRRNESLREIEDLRSKFATNNQRIATLTKVLSEIPRSAMLDISDRQPRVVFEISRRVNDALKTFEVEAASYIEPGDVLTVRSISDPLDRKTTYQFSSAP